MKQLDQQYWQERWKENNTPWDMGYASPALTAFMQGRYNKAQDILLPGAGNAHEFDWLLANGFAQTIVLDIAKQPLDNIAKRAGEQVRKNLIQGDFFEHSGTYDLILEQTFFCALDPQLRPAYVEQAARLLRSGGMLVGLLFDFPLTTEGPPFGGNEDEYRQLFSKYFKIAKLERAYNSIAPRSGREFFFILIKP